MDTLNLIAWIGAITGLSALIWDFIRWLRSRPRLKINIRPHTAYPDSEILNTQIDDKGMKSQQLRAYHHIELINRGELPTTIIDAGVFVKNKKFTIKDSISAFKPHYNKSLPYVLSPGELWSCRFPDDQVEDQSNFGIPKLYIRVSYRDKPIIKKMVR